MMILGTKEFKFEIKTNNFVFWALSVNKTNVFCFLSNLAYFWRAKHKQKIVNEFYHAPCEHYSSI